MEIEDNYGRRLLLAIYAEPTNVFNSLKDSLLTHPYIPDDLRTLTDRQCLSILRFFDDFDLEQMVYLTPIILIRVSEGFDEDLLEALSALRMMFDYEASDRIIGEQLAGLMSDNQARVYLTQVIDTIIINTCKEDVVGGIALPLIMLKRILND